MTTPVIFSGRAHAARARRCCATIERDCEEVLALRTGRATGATPSADDARHAKQVADLSVYLRQSHGRGVDLAALGDESSGAAPQARLVANMIDVQNGTPESLWRAWPDLERLPILDLSGWPATAPIVVIAPHPDDEMLGIGGTLQALRRRGHRVEFVAVTDGEGVAPGVRPVHPLQALAPGVVARAAAALADWLGFRRSKVTHLHLPDGGVSGCRDEELVAAIRCHLQTRSIVLAP